MQFYSFSFGEMKVAQADAASPKVVAVDVSLAFRSPDIHAVQSLELHVLIPHDPDKTIADTEREAYARAGELLRAAADLCAARTPADLAEASKEQVIVANRDGA